jgi:hypothetical protein
MPREYSLKKGAPSDEALFVRLTVSRTFKPDLAGYTAVPEWEVEAAKDTLDAMLYDITAIEVHHEADYHEILFPPIDNDKTKAVWEVVDKYGTVWSEMTETDDD